ncbi:AIPR family protein [Alphaproteobacteria bacterium]|nr:AIPR family protein [Alphaproteobacteria bacterium]
MTDIFETLNSLIDDVVVRAVSYKTDYQEAFFDIMNEALASNGDVKQLDYVAYLGYSFDRKPMRIDGYSYETDDGPDASDLHEITLVNMDFVYEGSSEPISKHQTLNTGDLEKKFLEMKLFVNACGNTDLATMIEGSSDYEGLTQTLHQNYKKLSKINLLYVTAANFTGRITEFQAEHMDGIKVNKQLYDIRRHHSVMTAKGGAEPTEIVFNDYGHPALPALKTSDGGNTKSLLLAMPGELLYEIYEEHGARLLEQNVRTYLQARGNVNKGMIATLRENPERFFAYNNGLTATASSYESSEETDKTISITGLKNLQIVNGGQTTASIHYSKFKSDADLSRVFVQIKLSIIEPDLLGDIVPKIAQYANTQNKVNAADFFANHPFHRQFEVLSKSIATPRQDNTLSNHGSKWYYERARGAYDNETYKLQAERDKKAFRVQHPKQQLIKKEDLAKALMSFDGHPDIVSKGGQAAFVKHASVVGLPESFEKISKSINEIFFKDAIAQVIIFRELEKLIPKAEWYEGGGTRACTITYSIAWLSLQIKAKKDTFLDLNQVWNMQSLTPDLKKIFISLTPEVYKFLRDSTPPTLTAVPQWAKRKGCWDKMKSEFDYKIDDELLSSATISKELKNEGKTGARRAQRQLNLDMCEVAMSKIKPNGWKAIKQFTEKHGIYKELNQLQQRDLDKLATASEIKIFELIKPKLVKNLLPIFEQLRSLDFDFYAYNIEACLYE